MQSKFRRESLLYKRIDGKVRCNVCERRCLLVNGGTGWCRTRRNENGKLITLVYGAISSLHADPIEKKPFYHFFPGTYAYTVGGWSCNFACPWCQNWEIARVQPPRNMEYLSPKRFVEMTENANCQGTAISYNEPTLSLEWSLDVFRLARRRGLYNTYVTNGYMTPEALSLLIDAGLDAINVDIKGDAAAVRKFCRGINVEQVWSICRFARAHQVHLEITTLVIPTVNDSEMVLGEIAGRIARELGTDVPWHVSQYYPAHEFSVPPTPIITLEQAWTIGKAAGLEYVYLGNLPGHNHNSTYCPECHRLLVRRLGIDVIRNISGDGHCPTCNRAIAGVWSGTIDSATMPQR